jgi:hypothetical protein
MNYFIKRDLNEYGPYSLSDLQKYVASGNILLTDLCRSEGLTDWVPVSQVIGNIPVPAAPQPAAPQAAAGTVYGGTAGTGAAAYGTQGSHAAPVGSQYPPPPSLHWGICLLLTIITCGLFSWVWLFVQSAWVKRVQPDSKAILYFSVALGVDIVTLICTIALGVSFGRQQNVVGYLTLIRLAQLAAHIVVIVGCFNLKNSIEEHFNSAEPIGLRLSGVITFIMSFFLLGHIYFQYHFTRINEMKQRQMMGYSA